MAAEIHWADYLVLASFLVISLGIGVYHSLSGGRQRTTSEFIMADRSLSVIPTTISMVVSFLSSITILGTTAEMYSYGAQYMLMMNVAFTVGTILAAVFFVPWIYPLQLVSINEYLELRFKSRSVRIMGSLLSVVMGVIYMGTATFGPAIALEAATGLPVSISIPVMSVVAVTYTALGGMKAVIWTDVFQFGIMVLGMVAVLVKGVMVVGSVDKVADICSREGRFQWADWNPDPTARNTVWSFAIGYNISWMKQYGLSQAAVQRYSAIGSVTKARMVMLLNVPALVILNTIACCTGLVVFAYFSSIRCDPLENGSIGNMNQLLPYFVTMVFTESPGFAGLFLATLYGAALSSISSSLSGVSANLWEDVLQFRFGYLSESSQALLNRLLVVFFGILATGMAFLTSMLPGTIIQIAITLNGSIGGPLFGLFLLGGITRYANWKGTVIGCCFGLVATFCLSVGSMGISIRHPKLPGVSVEGCSLADLGEFGNNSEWITDTTFTELQNFTTTLSLNQSDWTTKPGKAYVKDLTGLNRFLALSFHWYVLLGTAVTFIFGSIFSILLKDEKADREVEERLLFPFIRRRGSAIVEESKVSKDSKEMETNVVVFVAEKSEKPRINFIRTGSTTVASVD